MVKRLTNNKFIERSKLSHKDIDNYNFSMVATEDMVNPREADRGVFYDIDTVGTQFLKVTFAQRLVIGVVAESIEHGSYFYTFATFLSENIKE